MDTENERKSLLAKLALLEKVMKLHAWTSFGQKEAEEAERTETNSKASGGTDN